MRYINIRHDLSYMDVFLYHIWVLHVKYNMSGNVVHRMRLTSSLYMTGVINSANDVDFFRRTRSHFRLPDYCVIRLFFISNFRFICVI